MRPDERPTAPASMAASTSLTIGLQLVGRRGTCLGPEHGRAHRPVADEERDVRTELLALDLVEVLGERLPPRGQVVRSERERDQLPADRRDRRERVAAVPRELGREALAQVADERSVDEERAIGMTVRVDEARRHDHAADVQLERDLAVGHGAQVAHGRDPIAADADVGAPARSTRAIDDAPAAQEQVESCHEGHGATSGRHGRGQRDTATLRVPWGHSSAGRASAWHAEGPGFESPWLHQSHQGRRDRMTPDPPSPARSGLDLPHRPGPRRPRPPVVDPSRTHLGRRGRRCRVAELRDGLSATGHGLPAGARGRVPDHPRGRRPTLRLPLRRASRPLPVRTEAQGGPDARRTTTRRADPRRADAPDKGRGRASRWETRPLVA